MKKIFIVCLLSVTTALNAQDFVGTLTYVSDFEVSQKMLDMGMTKDDLKARMSEDGTWADTIETTYKNGFYKQLNLSREKSWVIYRPDSNKLYSFSEGEASDICTVSDASIDLEQKLKGKFPTVKLLDTIIKYKEYDLKMVEVDWEAGTYYYLFAEGHFKTNPENFKGHIYDGFYEYLKLSKSLPIMIIKKAGGMMTFKISLVISKEHKVDESEFKIPNLVEDEELSSFKIGSGKMMKIKE